MYKNICSITSIIAAVIFTVAIVSSAAPATPIEMPIETPIDTMIKPPILTSVEAATLTQAGKSPRVSRTPEDAISSDKPSGIGRGTVGADDFHNTILTFVGAGSLENLYSDSEEFDLDELMKGFDPDADFGGLGFTVETGPGLVSIGVIDTDGEFIDGIVITEDGFRTDKFTGGRVPCIIENVPYGERVYGIYLPYSFSVEAVTMVRYDNTGGGSPAPVRLNITDTANLPPVDISDESARWEIIFILRQHMKIKVNYYMVSPNDRFYFFRYEGSPVLGDMAPKASEEDAPADAAANVGEDRAAENNEIINEIEYRVNMFEGAPLRAAVYIEMPALKNVKKIRLEGEGFGATNAGAINSGATGANESNRAGNESITIDGDSGTASGWILENECGDFLLPDWTAVDRSCQLVVGESEINPDNVTFIRFFVLTLPSAYEGARLRFEKIILAMDDGSEIEFTNPDRSALTVQIINAPKPL